MAIKKLPFGAYASKSKVSVIGSMTGSPEDVPGAVAYTQGYSWNGDSPFLVFTEMPKLVMKLRYIEDFLKSLPKLFAGATGAAYVGGFNGSLLYKGANGYLAVTYDE